MPPHHGAREQHLRLLAPFVCESTVHLLQGKFSRDGAHSPGAILEAQEVLKRRRPDLGNSKLCQPDRAQL
jgi:lysozyme family protein